MGVFDREKGETVQVKPAIKRKIIDAEYTLGPLTNREMGLIVRTLENYTFKRYSDANEVQDLLKKLRID